MKVILKVTGITEVRDGKLLVQLQGKYGHAQLDVPASEQSGLTVGTKFTLSHEGLGIVGTIDETLERSKPLSEPQPSIDAMLRSVMGKKDEK